MGLSPLPILLLSSLFALLVLSEIVVVCVTAFSIKPVGRPAAVVEDRRHLHHHHHHHPFVSSIGRKQQQRRRSATTTITTTTLYVTPPPPVPNFCSDCGSDQMTLQIPDQDERLRAVCTVCGHIEYSNPKIVVSCVVFSSSSSSTSKKEPDSNSSSGSSILLAQRAIEPRLGYWGIPQGFMEHGETTREATIREVYEETGVTVTDLKLRAVYNVPGSVQLVYEGQEEVVVAMTEVEKEGVVIVPITMKNNNDTDDDTTTTTNSNTTTISSSSFLPVTSTLESSDIRWFPISDIPYDQLCFPTVQWAIEHCLTERATENGSGGGRIQQRTKFFDTNLEQWTEYEDEPPPLTTTTIPTQVKRRRKKDEQNCPE